MSVHPQVAFQGKNAVTPEDKGPVPRLHTVQIPEGLVIMVGNEVAAAIVKEGGSILPVAKILQDLLLGGPFPIGIQSHTDAQTGNHQPANHAGIGADLPLHLPVAAQKHNRLRGHRLIPQQGQGRLLRSRTHQSRGGGSRLHIPDGGKLLPGLTGAESPGKEYKQECNTNQQFPHGISFQNQ